MLSDGNFEGRLAAVRTSPSVHSLLPAMMMVRWPFRLRLGPSSPMILRRVLDSGNGTVHVKRLPSPRSCCAVALRSWLRTRCSHPSCRCCA